MYAYYPRLYRELLANAIRNGGRNECERELLGRIAHDIELSNPESLVWATTVLDDDSEDGIEEVEYEEYYCPVPCVDVLVRVRFAFNYHIRWYLDEEDYEKVLDGVDLLSMSAVFEPRD